MFGARMTITTRHLLKNNVGNSSRKGRTIISSCLRNRFLFLLSSIILFLVLSVATTSLSPVSSYMGTKETKTITTEIENIEPCPIINTNIEAISISDHNEFNSSLSNETKESDNTSTNTVLETSPHDDNSDELIHPPENFQEGNSLNNNKEEKGNIHLNGVPAVDRDLNGITVDISYSLNVPKDWYDSFETTSPSYHDTMVGLHGYNIWEGDQIQMLQGGIEDDNNEKDKTDHGQEENNTGDEQPQQQHENDQQLEEQQPTLSSLLEFLKLSNPSYKLIGSPLDYAILKKLLNEIKPKIFLEVGVFQGMTSTWVAKYFESHSQDGFEDSYVLSMDTWLLDLRFTWNGIKSKHIQETKTALYFTGTSQPQGGYSTMYYHFLANCIMSQTTHRIIPLPTASQNGAMTLLSHGIRPDFIYVDASHSNPDVHIDYENFYTILRPGGVIAFDDTGIGAVRAAFDALVEKYDLEAHESHKQAYVYKRKEKYE